MIPIVKADGTAERQFINELKARCESNDRDVTAAVAKIIEDVRQNGDRAVRAYTETVSYTHLTLPTICSV